MTDTFTLQTRLIALVTAHFGAIETIAMDPLDARWDELQPDSLDAVEISMQIEDEFGIQLTDDELEPFLSPDGLAGKTLRDMLVLIESKREQPA